MTNKKTAWILLLLMLISLFTGSASPVFAAAAGSAPESGRDTDAAETAENAQAADGSQDELTIQILDLAGLLPADSYASLEAQAEVLSGQYDCGIYVLTTDTDMSDYALDELANLFFTEYTPGVGDDPSGILLVVKPDTREYALRTTGSRAEYAFNDYGQQKLEEAFLPAFREDRWEDGLTGYITTCGDFLQKADAGHPVRKNPAGTIAICIVVSCLISLVICLILRRNMKSVHIGSEASAYVVGGIQLSDQYDRFSHKTETRTKIEKSTSKSGSSGRSGTF